MANVYGNVYGTVYGEVYGSTDGGSQPTDVAQQAFLEDLFQRRRIRGGAGYNPAWFLELEGAEIVIPTAFEPDPDTHRSHYYYNAITNALYVKITSRNENGIIVSSWKQASNQ